MQTLHIPSEIAPKEYFSRLHIPQAQHLPSLSQKVGRANWCVGVNTVS